MPSCTPAVPTWSWRTRSSALLADIGQELVILREAHGKPELLRDGAEVRYLIAERHGRQRVWLGWVETMLRREYQMLREEAVAAVHRVLSVGSAGSRAAVTALERLMEDSLQASLACMRVVQNPETIVAGTEPVTEATHRRIERVKGTVLGETGTPPPDAARGRGEPE